MRKRALADFDLAKTRLAEWLYQRGVIDPGAHLYDHGNVGDLPGHPIHRCPNCPTTFAVSETRPNKCPRCGHPGELHSRSEPPEPDDACRYSAGGGPCPLEQPP